MNLRTLQKRPKTITTIASSICCCFLLMNHQATAFSTTSSITPPLRVFCYGDSLTAGTAPPLFELYPYAPHLERAVNAARSSSSSSSSPVQIRWRGLPGWTSSNMKEDIDDSTIGLRSTILKISNPSISLVVLLAGTNDLAYASKASDVTDVLIDMHNMCLEQGVKRTIAVGIPQSAWQNQNLEVKNMVKEVNASLESYCKETQATRGEKGNYATFCPFPFEYAANDVKWSSDGLHLTSEGYEALGLGLVPTVLDVLDDL
mmetsp:Transcript_25883/g.34360  ORF Transcript_25883/g.34360 Transcript_25883/m.34360 type:complete len:260 (+) Transcript_25883:1-780(+)